MSELQKEKIEVAGATVDFYKYNEGDVEVYEFDTSRCGPPEPMVNAMAGLKMIDGPNLWDCLIKLVQTIMLVMKLWKMIE